MNLLVFVVFTTTSKILMTRIILFNIYVLHYLGMHNFLKIVRVVTTFSSCYYDFDTRCYEMRISGVMIPIFLLVKILNLLYIVLNIIYVDIIARNNHRIRVCDLVYKLLSTLILFLVCLGFFLGGVHIQVLNFLLFILICIFQLLSSLSVLISLSLFEIFHSIKITLHSGPFKYTKRERKFF